MENLADKIGRHNNIYEIPIGQNLIMYIAVMGGGLLSYYFAMFFSVQYASFIQATALTVITGVIGIIFAIIPKGVFRVSSVFINMLFMGFAVSLIYIKLNYSFPVLNAVFVTIGMFALFALVIILLLFNIGVKWLPTLFMACSFIILIASIILIFKTKNSVFICMAFCSLIIFANSVSLKTFIYGQNSFSTHLAVANCISAGIAIVAVIIVLAALSEGSCDCDCDGGDCCGDCYHTPSSKTKITRKNYRIK